MNKIIICMSFVSVVVMMQASEKKKTITTVDQLRNEMRSERDKFKQDHGSSYVEHLQTKGNRINHEPTHIDKKNDQKKESI